MPKLTVEAARVRNEAESVFQVVFDEFTTTPDSGDNDDPKDPFERIRYAQLMELADQFRNDRLVERCYEVWKSGYEWIIVSLSVLSGECIL